MDEHAKGGGAPEVHKFWGGGAIQADVVCMYACVHTKVGLIKYSEEQCVLF